MTVVSLEMSDEPYYRIRLSVIPNWGREYIYFVKEGVYERGMKSRKQQKIHSFQTNLRIFLVLPKFGVMNHKLLYSYSYEVIASTKSL